MFAIGDIVQNKSTRRVGVVMEAINRGSNGGRYYKVRWLHNQKITTPAQSTISYVRTMNDRKAESKMKIMRASHPNIFKAFDDIIADNIASAAIVKEAKKKIEEGYTVNNQKINISDVEKFLGELSDDDREMLTMGDQDEAEESLGNMKGFKDANSLLGEFFENL